MLTNQERVLAYAKEREKKGSKRITAWFEKKDLEKLDAIIYNNDNYNRASLVRELVRRALNEF